MAPDRILCLCLELCHQPKIEASMKSELLTLSNVLVLLQGQPSMNLPCLTSSRSLKSQPRISIIHVYIYHTRPGVSSFRFSESTAHLEFF